MPREGNPYDDDHGNNRGAGWKRGAEEKGPPPSDGSLWLSIMAILVAILAALAKSAGFIKVDSTSTVNLGPIAEQVAADWKAAYGADIPITDSELSTLVQSHLPEPAA